MIVIESINNVCVTVSDIKRAVDFYKDLFDFDVVEKQGAGYVYLKMGEMVIALHEQEGFANTANSGYSISFFVDEDDFDDALESLEEKNIPIVYGPENIRNGQAVIFADPDGNRIELSYPRV